MLPLLFATLKTACSWIYSSCIYIILLRFLAFNNLLSILLKYSVSISCLWWSIFVLFYKQKGKHFMCQLHQKVPNEAMMFITSNNTSWWKLQHQKRNTRGGKRISCFHTQTVVEFIKKRKNLQMRGRWISDIHIHWYIICCMHLGLFSHENTCHFQMRLFMAPPGWVPIVAPLHGGFIQGKKQKNSLKEVRIHFEITTESVRWA